MVLRAHPMQLCRPGYMLTVKKSVPYPLMRV